MKETNARSKRSGPRTGSHLRSPAQLSTAHLGRPYAARHAASRSPLSTPRCIMPFMFEKLEVYQKAVDFADEVASLTEGFPTRLRIPRRPIESRRAFDRYQPGRGKRPLHKARSPQFLHDRSRLPSGMRAPVGDRTASCAHQRPRSSRSEGPARDHRQNDQWPDQWTRQARWLIRSRLHLSARNLSRSAVRSPQAKIYPGTSISAGPVFGTQASPKLGCRRMPRRR